MSNLDAADFLDLAVSALPENSLTYLDPPYYVKGNRRLYANHYDSDDHAAIAAKVRKLPFRWIVSYDDEPEIRRLYRPYRSMRYSLSYIASERQGGAEVMYFSPKLVIPSSVPATGEFNRRRIVTRTG